MCKQIMSFKDLPKIIAVDFDGTLVSDAWPEIGEPNEEMFAMMKALKKQGVKVILWTSRNYTQSYGDLVQVAVDYCKGKGLEFDAVNENIREVKELTGQDTRKVYADMYIDDKAYGHQCTPTDIQLALGLPVQNHLIVLDAYIKARYYEV